jgi:hypothetical protein
MPTAQPLARLRFGAGKPPGRAGIDHLDVLISEGHLHVADHCDRAGVHLRFECARRTLDFACLGRPALGLPSRHAAIENEDLFGAENAQGPPHPRR